MNQFAAAVATLDLHTRQRLAAAARADWLDVVHRLSQANDMRLLGQHQGQFRALSDILAALTTETATQGHNP